MPTTNTHGTRWIKEFDSVWNSYFTCSYVLVLCRRLVQDMACLTGLMMYQPLFHPLLGLEKRRGGEVEAVLLPLSNWTSKSKWVPLPICYLAEQSYAHLLGCKSYLIQLGLLPGKCVKYWHLSWFHDGPVMGRGSDVTELCDIAIPASSQDGTFVSSSSIRPGS